MHFFRKLRQLRKGLYIPKETKFSRVSEGKKAEFQVLKRADHLNPVDVSLTVFFSQSACLNRGTRNRGPDDKRNRWNKVIRALFCDKSRDVAQYATFVDDFKTSWRIEFFNHLFIQPHIDHYINIHFFMQVKKCSRMHKSYYLYEISVFLSRLFAIQVKHDGLFLLTGVVLEVYTWKRGLHEKNHWQFLQLPLSDL